MSQRTMPFLWTCALLVAACKKIEDTEGEFALGYDGDPSCASATLPKSGFPENLTVEAWVQADSDASYAVHPLVVWSGAFALYEDADGIGGFTTEEPDGNGPSTLTEWMDGDLHHVAATWQAETTSTALYVDGVNVAFHGSVTIGDSANERLWVGCWGDKGYHEGIIDEVRLSDSLRYDGDFDVPTGPFELDDMTLDLWHFDDGDGDYGLDENSRADLELSSVEWVEFNLADEI